MKKLLALLLAVLMILLLVACGAKEKSEDFGGTWKVDSIEYEGAKFSVEEWNNMEDEDLTDKDDSSVDETASSETENDTTTGDDAEWKQFLKDYEAWVDDYITIVKKYKDNPSDMSILSDYTEMVSEMADWTERADEIELELADTSAALEYSAELLRIAGKLAEAAY